PSHPWNHDDLAPVERRQPRPNGNDRKKGSWDNRNDGEHSSDAKERTGRNDDNDDDNQGDHYKSHEEDNNAGDARVADDSFANDKARGRRNKPLERDWNKSGDPDQTEHKLSNKWGKSGPKKRVAKRNDASHDKKDDGYPNDRNDGFLEDMDDMDMESIHRKKRRLHRLH
ncbi:unnamed protein product, partial [Ixodes hexagonus]